MLRFSHSAWLEAVEPHPLGRLAVSLPLQIEARELLQECVPHALQLDFEALFELANAGLISVACGSCGAWPKG
jgi:hypothetical protein